MSHPLRIAMFVGTFPVVSETFILRQITGLLDMGHEVDIYADNRGDTSGPLHEEIGSHRLLERTTFMDMPPEAAPWELPVWPITGRTWTPGADGPVPNSLRLARALPRLLGSFARQPGLTARVLRRAEYGFQADSLSALHRLYTLARLPRRYDVLHAHFGPVGNSFRFARELWDAPLVVAFHGYDFSTLPRRQGSGMYESLFATVDLVTVNSEFTRSRVAALGCPAAKIRLLPVGLDLRRFVLRERRADAPLRLLTVARLVEIKGHEFALRAVAKVRAAHPGLRYDIVGDGPLRGRLEGLVEELGLREVVTLHGARDGTFIAGLLATAHVGLLASVSIDGDAEGQGLFLQEAQACGLPVVATRHGALPEGLADGQSGFLVTERDVAELADRLEFLGAHPERWGEMGRAGRAFVEQRYDSLQLNRQWVELGREAMLAYRLQEPTHGPRGSRRSMGK